MSYGFSVDKEPAQKTIPTKKTGYGFSVEDTNQDSPITPFTTIVKLQGGGAFNVGTGGTGELIKEERSNYGGLPTKKGYERADIVPVSLGGSNRTRENITYEPYPTIEKIKKLFNSEYVPQTNTDKYLIKEILPAYKSGKISLNDARVKAIGFLDAEQKGLNANQTITSQVRDFTSQMTPFGMAKNLFNLAKPVIKGLIDQIKNPSEVVKEAERRIGASEPTNKIEKYATLPIRTVEKAATRLLLPAFEPIAEDINDMVFVNKISSKIASGEMPQSALKDINVLNKTVPQIVGDVGQAVLSVYSPSIFKDILAGGIKSKVIQGGVAGLEAGTGFGIAQALSSGSKDIKEIAKTMVINMSAGFGLGLATAGLGSLLGKIREAKVEIKNPKVKELIGEVETQLTKKIEQEKPTTPFQLLAERQKTEAPVEVPKTEIIVEKPTTPFGKIHDELQIEKAKVEVKPKTYSTIHEGGEVKKIEGTPVKIVEGVETFLHKDENGNWAVSEATTGRNISSGGFENSNFAIKEAKANIENVGVDKFNQLISKNKLPVETVDPLIQEAKKYKSADEFAKSRGTPIYHGTNADFNVFDKTKIGSATDEGFFGRGFYFGNTEAFARVAPNGRGAKNIMEVYPSPDIKLFDISKIKSKTEMADLLNMSEDALIQETNGIIRPVRGQSGQFTSHLQDLGYDGAVVKRGGDAIETVIFEPDKIKTKSQLTEIWDKAQEKAPTAEQTVISTSEPLKPQEGGKTSEISPSGEVSGVAKNIEAKAIEKGLIEKSISELPEYDASTIKKQSELGSKFSVEQLEEIARTGNLPDGMKPATPLSILEDVYKNNPEKLIELAKSPLTSRISESASEVSLSRMREKGGTVENIKKVIDSRKKQYEEKIKSETKKIREEIKKVNTKDVWSSFVDSITC